MDCGVRRVFFWVEFQDTCEKRYYTKLVVDCVGHA